MTTTSPRPAFRDLPIAANGLRCSWSYFGEGDERGTLNLLTERVVAAAAAEVRTGQRFSVSLPLDEPAPTFFTRKTFQHSIYNLAPFAQDDFVDQFYLQASSQWDGFRHIGDAQVGYYSGAQTEDVRGEGTRLGIQHWSDGIVGRGVLVDVASQLAGTDYNPLERHEIPVSVVQAALDAQGVELREGDIMLLRTGFIEAFRTSSVADKERVRDSMISAGLSPAEETAEFLWDSGLAALAVDNPAVEAYLPVAGRQDLHGRMIPMLGLVFGEFFDFEALTAACRADGRYTCLLVGVPLNLPGGVGSPANAIAIR